MFMPFLVPEECGKIQRERERLPPFKVSRSKKIFEILEILTSEITSVLLGIV